MHNICWEGRWIVKPSSHVYRSVPISCSVSISGSIAFTNDGLTKRLKYWASCGNDSQTSQYYIICVVKDGQTIIFCLFIVTRTNDNDFPAMLGINPRERQRHANPKTILKTWTEDTVKIQDWWHEPSKSLSSVIFLEHQITTSYNSLSLSCHQWSLPAINSGFKKNFHISRYGKTI